MRQYFHLSKEASRKLTKLAFKVGKLPDIFLEDLVLSFDTNLLEARKIVGVDHSAVDHFLIPLLLRNYNDDVLLEEFYGISEFFKDDMFLFKFKPLFYEEPELEAIEGKSVEA